MGLSSLWMIHTSILMSIYHIILRSIITSSPSSSLISLSTLSFLSSAISCLVSWLSFVKNWTRAIGFTLSHFHLIHRVRIISRILHHPEGGLKENQVCCLYFSDILRDLLIRSARLIFHLNRLEDTILFNLLFFFRTVILERFFAILLLFLSFPRLFFAGHSLFKLYKSQ